MKSIKFLLAALVFSGLFASCAKEAAPEREFQTNEYAGAELVGTDISVNFSAGDVKTKLDANGKWENTDKLGLGWVLNAGSNVTDLQVKDPNVEPGDVIYGNHMFQLGTDGKMTTKGNVYVGWHFGYYPFNYQDRLGQQLEFTLNPQQIEKGGDLERYNSGLYLSAREFLTTKNLDKNNQLTGVEYAVYPVLKTISVNVTPEATFTGSSVLSTLNISKVTINVGANYGAFPTGKIKVAPSKLAEIQYDYNEETEEYDYNAEKTKTELYKSLSNALAHSGFHSEISVAPLSKEINLSGAQVVRVHTLPTQITLDPAKIEFTILVDNGKFTVKYVDPKTLKAGEELTDVQKANNDAIVDFVAAYAKDGALSAYNFNEETGKYRPGKNVNLILTKDMFKEDFTRISSEDIWNKAVAMVDDLGLEDAEFTIVAGEDGKEWSFTDEDKDGNLINLPKGADIEVIGTMKLGANGEWPTEGIAAEKVVVNKGVTLNVADGVLLNAEIINNGTIKAGYLSKVKTVDNSSSSARIEVVYGSYVKVVDGKAGIIAYAVTGEDKAYQINALTNPNVDSKERNAFVNTLVINNNHSFNLSMIDTDLVDNDPYTGTIVNGQKLERMHLMSIELNNGTLAADANSGASVAAISVLGGENAIWNTNVTGNIDVVAGKVVVDAAKVGTYKESLKVEGKIVNKGDFTSNTTLYTKEIENPAKAKTTVKEGETIYYTEKYIQGGTATGTIIKLANLPGVFTVVDANKGIPNFASAVDSKARATALANFINSSDFKEGSTIVLPASTIIELVGNSNDQFTKSFNLVGAEGTIIKSTHTDPTRARGIKIKGSQTNNVVVNIKNVTLESEQYVLYAKEYATINLQNVVCKSSSDVAILVDNSNCQETNTTVVNAYNVTIDKDDIIWLNALPCTSYNNVKKVSYIKFNYFGGNVTDAAFKAQDITRSTGDNLFVNGVALPAYTK